MHLQMVGTSLSLENPKLIMYPSITICAHQIKDSSTTSRYYANLPWPWFYYQGSSGPTPNLSEIVDTVLFISHINNSRYRLQAFVINGKAYREHHFSQDSYEPAFIKIEIQVFKTFI